MPDRWPGLYIVGAARSGTSSLYEYLRHHPSIFMPDEKEPHFFSDRDDEGYWDDPEELAERRTRYLALFEGRDDVPVWGEASPSYLTYSDRTAARIADRADDPCIVVSLRHPVERAWSHWLLGQRVGRLSEDFATLVDAAIDGRRVDGRVGWEMVEASRYHAHLSDFLDVFDRDRVVVLDFHEWTADPVPALRRVFDALDVDPGVASGIDTDLVFGENRRPRNAMAEWLLHSDAVEAAARTLLPFKLRVALGERVLKESWKPSMDPKAGRRLAEHLAPEVDALEELLDRDLGHFRGASSTG